MAQSPSACTIVPPNEGQAYWVVGDSVVFKLAGEQTRGKFAFAETTVAPGGGPPPHVHYREDEIFYVLEGQFSFISGDQIHSASSGDAFYLPKEIVHTFKNVGTKPGRLLVGAIPSGFEHFVPEAGYPCSDLSKAAPPIDEAAIAKLMAGCMKYGLEMKFDFKPGAPAPARPTDREFWVLGAHVRFKLLSEDTLGNFSLVEVTADPGTGIPPHLHHAMDEVFYVLEGSVEFQVEGRSVSAPAGTFVHVPPGVSHGFQNTGSTAAKVLDYHTPGGFEKFFEECGRPCTDRKSPPAALPPEPEVLMAILDKHGMALG